MDKVESGMTLAKTLYDSTQRVLIGEGTRLLSEYIEKLRNRGFDGVYIEDELSKDVRIEETISTELRNRAIKSLKECNIDASIDIAKAIVDQLKGVSSISLDMLDLRDFDDYTYKHSVNVAVLSTVIGIGLHLKEKDLVDLCAAGLLHDLGKLGIAAELINKQGFLTSEEFEIIKSHSQLSYDLIKDKWNISAKTKAAVLEHHENEDGTGYPRGLFGEEIHRYSKIVHVADVYDALTTKRPYKKPYSIAEAMEYLMGSCGRLFDKSVVEHFMNYVPIYPKGITIYLSTGESAIVVENNHFRTLRPVVRLFNGKTYDLFEDRTLRSVTILQAEDSMIASRSEVTENETSRIRMKEQVG
jgi:HD-GYP domain-containing protein (c-di-GMP phosphodiesterase class II)